MQPLHVTAVLVESIVCRRPPMLDGILARVIADQNHMVPIGDPSTWPEIDIPLQKHESGAFWMCSSGYCEVEASDIGHKHRRAPWVEYARLGNAKIRRVDIATAEDKSYRIPYEKKILHQDTIEWWCIGDEARTRELLMRCHYLGKYVATGKGRVREWIVEPCEPWGKGFPILRDGKPMRPLPLDTPGLVSPFKQAFATVRPPYWFHAAEELVAVPC